MSLHMNEAHSDTCFYLLLVTQQDIAPPRVPVPDVITATEPVEWTQDNATGHKTFSGRMGKDLDICGRRSVVRASSGRMKVMGEEGSCEFLLCLAVGVTFVTSPLPLSHDSEDHTRKSPERRKRKRKSNENGPGLRKPSGVQGVSAVPIE
ncbi:hypothetical protein AVEN_43096-1 [Araneus ventricosus]|uniref:Uncharacterized protein n=1 Tax=Araneus ventricosus TaxID=182803 RepID=A0A4Y2J790_ARAVE|nr:hypothetical protein AVEN_43096-1 [Araneus ventricosus]